MDTRNRTTSLDVAKCLAAFLVVAIHADFPGMFGKYVNAWARIAGPLFFIISGYYYPILASQGKQKRQIRKLLKYLLIGSTVFIVYECTVAALKGNLSECLNIWIIFTGLPYVLLGCLIRKNGGWHPCKTNAGFGNKSMAAAIGQRYSSYIYMYHPLVISLFSSIPWLSQNKLYVSIQPIVVFTATTACIILIQGLYSVIQKTRQRPIS